MQLDRNWSSSYAPDTPPPPPPPSQQQSYYHTSSAYADPALNTRGPQNDDQTRETQLGAWKQGSKRVRPNDYPLQETEYTGTRASPGVPQYGRPQPDSTVPNSQYTGGPQYYQADPTPQSNAYPAYTPMGGPGHPTNAKQPAMPTDQFGVPRPANQAANMAVDANGRRVSLKAPHSGRQESVYTTPRDMPSQYREAAESSYNSSVSQSRLYSEDEEYAPTGVIRSSSDQNVYEPLSGWGEAQYDYSARIRPTRIPENHSTMYGKDASLHLKLQSLSVLDNLSTQIILNLAKPSLADIEQLTNDEDSEESQAYMTRKNLFDQTRKVYSRDGPFIDAIAIQLFTPAQQEVIRKANKATFISSILEGHDVSFFDLNEFFLEIFVPIGQRLLKWQGGVFLELKTQVYISALANSDGPVGSLLDELFPSDLEARITTRHPDMPTLAPSEQDFMERARARKQYLQAEPAHTALQALPRKYEWRDFLREFASCVSKNVETILNPPLRAQPSYQNQSRPAESGMPSSSYELLGPSRRTGASSEDETSDGADVSNLYNNFGPSASDRRGRLPGPALATESSASSVPPASKPAKPAATSAPRQPWKQEEEDALLAGLTEVKGPHWSQILSLYGRGGSVSEVLKDRNQIQLKDKARNLKLWYLKMGNDVPACLQGVTGELRKRGGARVRAALGLDVNDDGPGAGAGADVW